MTNQSTNPCFDDPIVEAVRQAGEQMAHEAGYDLHALCERLREAEKRHPERFLPADLTPQTMHSTR